MAEDSRRISHESRPADCFLCSQAGGPIVWQDDFARVVVAGDADHPGFCRVIVNRHVAEMTDLEAREQGRLMQIVFEVERALRKLLRPDKMNLASLGNQVPHLHWHVIPRYRDDPHFPSPVWAARTGSTPRSVGEYFEAELAQALKRSLG
jgi:diadenosine tetraphosphate (Ap4A) HIT family hydrolase